MTRTLDHIIARDVPSLIYLKDKVMLLDRESQKISSNILGYIKIKSKTDEDQKIYHKLMNLAKTIQLDLKPQNNLQSQVENNRIDKLVKKIEEENIKEDLNSLRSVLPLKNKSNKQHYLKKKTTKDTDITINEQLLKIESCGDLIAALMTCSQEKFDI